MISPELLLGTERLGLVEVSARVCVSGDVGWRVGGFGMIERGAYCVRVETLPRLIQINNVEIGYSLGLKNKSPWKPCGTGRCLRMWGGSSIAHEHKSKRTRH
jgi:hypothetical protein